MSQYLNFYIKNKEDYLPIASYSRNSAIYEYGADYAEWETGTILTVQLLESIIHNIKNELKKHDAVIKTYTDQMAFIASANNSLEDKMKEYTSLNESITEIEDISAALLNAKEFYAFLVNIWDEIKYNDKYKECDYVWFGIEWNPDYIEEGD